MTINSISQAKLSQKPLDISLFYTTLSKLVLNTFHAILGRSTLYKNNCPSQIGLAKQLGLSQQTISRHIAILYEHNLIIKFYQGHKQRLHLVTHPSLLESEVLSDLKHFFDNFFKFSLFLVCSINAFSAERVQLSYKDYYLSKNIAQHRASSSGRTYSCLPIRDQSSDEGYLCCYDGVWSYGVITGHVNLRRDLDEFSQMIIESRTDSTEGSRATLKKEESNVKQELFSEQQLVQLAQFPYEVLQYAIQKLKERSDIENPFGYVLTICRSQMAKQADKEAQPLFEKTKQNSSRGNTPYHGTTVSASQDRQKRDSEAQRYQAFLNARKERRLGKLRDMGIDGSTLTDYQIKLALAGEPYHIDDIKKSIAASRFGSAEAFKSILQNLIKS